MRHHRPPPAPVPSRLCGAQHARARRPGDRGVPPGRRRRSSTRSRSQRMNVVDAERHAAAGDLEQGPHASRADGRQADRSAAARRRAALLQRGRGRSRRPDVHRPRSQRRAPGQRRHSCSISSSRTRRSGSATRRGTAAGRPASRSGIGPTRRLSELIEKLNAANKIEDRAERDKAIAAIRASAPPAPRRVFVGKNAEKAATVSLADGNGKPRLTMTVDAAGNPQNRVPRRGRQRSCRACRPTNSDAFVGDGP